MGNKGWYVIKLDTHLHLTRIRRFTVLKMVRLRLERKHALGYSTIFFYNRFRLQAF